MFTFFSEQKFQTICYVNIPTHHFEKSQSYYQQISQHYQMMALILATIFAILTIGSSIDPSKISVALNCGSKTEVVASFDGSFKYQPDGTAVSGSSVDVDYHSDTSISASDLKYSHEKELYMFERHTYNEMTYSLPVRQGKNTLIMKFAEMYFNEAGKRVFNVKVGDKIVIEDLDIIEKSGSRFAAHEEYLEFDVKKDGIYIDGQRIPRAVENSKLKVSFAKGKADNPIIQGIMVYNKPIEESPRNDYLKLKRDWSSQSEMRKARKDEQKLKELVKIQKKKEKVVFRNDQLVFEQQEQKGNGDAAPPQRFGKIRFFLMSPVGIIIWAVAYVYTLIFAYKKVFKMGPSKEKLKQE